MRVQDLKTHPVPYVTVAELAEYWLVSRRQVYQQIRAGALPAIRLNPRLMRIRTADVIEFERRASTSPASSRALTPAGKPVRRTRHLIGTDRTASDRTSR